MEKLNREGAKSAAKNREGISRIRFVALPFAFFALSRLSLVFLHPLRARRMP
jgi:hypothetical protein